MEEANGVYGESNATIELSVVLDVVLVITIIVRRGPNKIRTV